MENSQSLDSIAENWYARLNNLKYYASRDDISLEKRQQCERMILVMIVRMMKVVPLYTEAMSKRFKPGTFKPGGVSFKDSGQQQ